MLKKSQHQLLTLQSKNLNFSPPRLLPPPSPWSQCSAGCACPRTWSTSSLQLHMFPSVFGDEFSDSLNFVMNLVTNSVMNFLKLVTNTVKNLVMNFMNHKLINSMQCSIIRIISKVLTKDDVEDTDNKGNAKIIKGFMISIIWSLYDFSLVLEHLKLLIVCLDFGLQGGHYSLSHPQLHLSESLACLKICQVWQFGKFSPLPSVILTEIWLWHWWWLKKGFALKHIW